MKQIIVNVGDLSIEEKQRVNEVLAKTKNIRMCDTPRWDRVITMYGPSFDGVNVGFDCHKRANPTHTPQQVLEMAGMAPSANQHVFLADTLIITDSSGNTIYDSTLEEKKKGHVHAELMAQYAEDAKTHTEPWKLWQFLGSLGWSSCGESPRWNETKEYRRKPKTKLIHGVEIPVFDFTPKVREKYCAANVDLPELFEDGYMSSEDCTFTQRMIERGLLYPCTEEGKQAAILHSKAMLGIA